MILFFYNRKKGFGEGEIVVRNYRLYLIEDEFAAHYFGRESMFFQLFREHERAFGELKYITGKQITYITKTVEVLKIHNLLQKQLGKIKGLRRNMAHILLK